MGHIVKNIQKTTHMIGLSLSRLQEGLAGIFNELILIFLSTLATLLLLQCVWISGHVEMKADSGTWHAHNLLHLWEPVWSSWRFSTHHFKNTCSCAEQSPDWRYFQLLGPLGSPVGRSLQYVSNNISSSKGRKKYSTHTALCTMAVLLCALKSNVKRLSTFYKR